MLLLKTILVSFILVVFLGCGGGSSGDSNNNVSSQNSAPVANAGLDINSTIGTTITLDANGCSDADNDTLIYTWTIVSQPVGSTATLSDISIVNPTIDVDFAGDYVISLIVNDGSVNSSADNITITVLSPVLWSAVEKIIDATSITGVDSAVVNPVLVRFDANNIHLYFSGMRYKTFAVVPADMYRLKSTDNGVTWSLPERMAQLEGSYQSYPVAYFANQLLIVWHDGTHAELHTTSILNESSLVAAPTKYLAYSSVGKEVIFANVLDGRLIGMWHDTAMSNSSPFTGNITNPATALTAMIWTHDSTYYQSTQLSDTKVLVLTTPTNKLFLATFNGDFTTPYTSLTFPVADVIVEYGGDSLYHGNYDKDSGYIYFSGSNSDKSKTAIYRVKYVN